MNLITQTKERRSAVCYPAPFDVDVTLLLKSMDTYRANIRTAVRGLWNGVWDYFTFLDQMALSIERGFTQAWYEGAKIYGIAPSELTDEEHNRLMSEVNKEIMFIQNFGQSIITNSKLMGGKLTPLFARAELWVSAYNRIRVLGGTYAAKDQKMEWRLGPTKEHCSSCSKYNGRVYRASIWRKHNIQPRMYELQCKGYNCECDFYPTDKPVNKGYPPAP